MAEAHGRRRGCPRDRRTRGSRTTRPSWRARGTREPGPGHRSLRCPREVPGTLDRRRRHHDSGEALAAPELDVLEHVRIDIAVLIDLRLGEHRETHVTQRFDPRADDIGAAGRDVGEDRRFGLERCRCSVRTAPRCGRAASDRERRIAAGRRRWGGHRGWRRGPCRDWGRPRPEAPAWGGGSHAVVERRFRRRHVVGLLFADAHALIFPQMSSVIALPTLWALSSNLVTGRSWVIGDSQSSAVSSGSALPASAIHSAYSA